MDTLFRNDLTNLGGLQLQQARTAEVATYGGHRALKLDGLALLPGLTLGDGCVEVSIAAEGPGYPGVAFRAADDQDYELAYAVPHVSRQWDALQYDPVFAGSNTWQLYNGPAYQAAVPVPTGEWFTLRIVMQGNRAAIRLNRERTLVVVRLAHRRAAGGIGVWTYRPAYFRDLRIGAAPELPAAGVLPPVPAGTVTEWSLEGAGVVACEPGGALNVNRYLPSSAGTARLTRHFETLAAGPVDIAFGFSDELALRLDGETVHTGTNTFTGFADRAARGYVEPGAHVVQRTLPPGEHTLEADLKVSEGFGWGLHLALRGRHARLLPLA